MKKIITNKFFPIALAVFFALQIAAPALHAQEIDDGSGYGNGSTYYGNVECTTCSTGGWYTPGYTTGTTDSSNWYTPSYTTNDSSWYTPSYTTTDTSNSSWYTPSYTTTDSSWYTPSYNTTSYWGTPGYSSSYYTNTSWYAPTYYPTTQYQTCPNGQTVPVGQACPSIPTQTKTCPDGTVVNINANCPTQMCTQEAKVCPDGSTVGRTGPNCSFAPCPTTTCPNGATPVNGVCPTTKTCPDGTVVNISDVCYMTCPSGARIPQGQTCPQMCADGTQAVNGVCYQTCSNGARIPTTQSCPTPTHVCPDGSTLPTNQACPVRQCANGQVVPAGQTCYQTCPNGQTVPEGSVCYQTCPNGQTVPTTNLCPSQTQTCWDGSVIPVNQSCPLQYKTCPNGTSVPVNQVCAQTCANGNLIGYGQTCYRTCPNGATIPDYQTCPVAAGYPWVDLRANTAAVPFGGSVVLTWTSQNTTSCVASNGWAGGRPLSGSETRYNITGTTNFTITCYNGNGQPVSDTVSVYTGTDQIKVNSVVTSLPTAVTNNSARCNGIGLISDHSSSNAWFEYGETANLGRTTATAFIGSAATSPFSNVLAGLKPSTTYYCRAVMTNAHGTVKGDIVRFTTKTNKVVYVKQTMTPVKKTITTTKQIICSDGSTVTVNNPTTAGLIADGSKLVAIQLEKVDGDLSGGSMASYRLSYKNVTNVPLSNVIFKVTIPEEFALLSATAGAYDKDTHTITVPVLSLDAGTQGSITWKVKVANDAPIGKAVVTTGYVDYTVPGTDGVTPVQDEVTAYVIGSIMPGGDAASATSSDMQSNRTFLPDTLIEWFALFAIILILMILGRSVYLSWKGEKEAH